MPFKEDKNNQLILKQVWFYLLVYKEKDFFFPSS
jgi:hypothetical protein